MKKAEIPANDQERLNKLASLNILDTASEKQFDQLTKQAVKALNCPIALIGLIDEKRLWLKSKVGLEVSQIDRETSICTYIVDHLEPLIVEDTSKDERFKDNPLVTGEPHVKSYFGVPLVTSDGHHIGSFCVMSPEIVKINDMGITLLKSLAQNAVMLMELREKNQQINMLDMQFSDIQHLSKTGGWELDVASGETTWSEEVYNIYGLLPGTQVNKDDGISYYTEESSKKLEQLLSNCIDNKVDFDEIFQFRDEDFQHKWLRVNGKPVVNRNSEVTKVVGTIQDVTQQKKREDELRANYKLQWVNSSLLEISAQDIPLKEKLDQTLELIVKLDDLGIKKQAGFFLMDEQKNQLVLTSEKELATPLLTLCKTIDIGQCLCGKAAEMKQILHASCVDERHENRFSGMKPHGHYNVPILYQGKVLGVMVLYLEHGHEKSEYELSFLHEISKMIADIIVSSNTKEELAKKNSKVSTLYHLSPDLIGLFDMEGNFLEVNPSWQSLLGYTKDELIGQPCYMLVHPEDVEITRQEILKVSAGKHVRDFEIRILKKGAEAIYISWVAYQGGTGDFFYAIGRDITVNKEKELERQFILNNMKVGTWKWDIVSNQLEWDDSNYKVYDIKKEEFSGAFEAWESRLHPDYKERALQDVNDALDGTKDFFTTFAILDSKGKTKYIGARADIIRDLNGKPLKMVGINWDRTEEEKSQLDYEEQKRLAFHNAKLASIGELAAGVGHEINNPLSIPKAYIPIILESINKGNLDQEDLKQKLSSMSIAIERIESIVKGLKTLTHHDENKMEYFDLIELVRETFRMLVNIYKKDNVHLTLDTDGVERAPILGHRGRLQQVLMNLLSNAKDALKESQFAEIEITIRNSDKGYQCTIHDNGEGIAESDMKRIFNPFFTTKKIGEGSGIGLSVCQKVLSEHKGKLWCHSKLGEGTSFHMLIPHRDEKIPQLRPKTQQTQKPAKINFSELSVLVCEDEPVIREIISMLLEDQVKNLVIATDGKDGLNRFRKATEKFDIIITDVKMPELDGISMLHTIHQEAELPLTLVLTGGVNIEEEYKDINLDELVSLFLYKPFKQAELFEAIQLVIEEKQIVDKTG
jgi:PAS domain S-box-containing protein